MEANYTYGDDHTIIRLSDDLDDVTIHGAEVASLALAINLQKSYPEKLRIIDLDYSFDFDLLGVDSLEDIRLRMKS